MEVSKEEKEALKSEHYLWQNRKSAYQGQISCVPGVLKTSMRAWNPVTTRLFFGIVQDTLSFRAGTFVTSSKMLSSSNTCKQDHILANHLHHQMRQEFFYSLTNEPMVPTRLIPDMVWRQTCLPPIMQLNKTNINHWLITKIIFNKSSNKVISVTTNY